MQLRTAIQGEDKRQTSKEMCFFGSVARTRRVQRYREGFQKYKMKAWTNKRMDVAAPSKQELHGFNLCKYSCFLLVLQIPHIYSHKQFAPLEPLPQISSFLGSFEEPMDSDTPAVEQYASFWESLNPFALATGSGIAQWGGPP